MPTLDSNEELQRRVRKCFTDTEMEYEEDEEITYFNIDQTIENLTQLILADREAAIREARLDGEKSAVQKIKHTIDSHKDFNDSHVVLELVETVLGDLSLLDSLNQPTKER